MPFLGLNLLSIFESLVVLLSKLDCEISISDFTRCIWRLSVEDWAGGSDIFGVVSPGVENMFGVVNPGVET